MQEVKINNNEKKRFVIASLFSNIDLFMKAFIKLGALPGYGCEINKWPAWIHMENFKYPDGTPVLTPPIEITWDDVLEMKRKGEEEKRDVSMEWWEENEKYYRHKRVEEVSGYEIKETIEKHYGADPIIILIGGPPCVQLSKLTFTNKTDKTRLIFEYARIISELNPAVALMEEAKELLENNNKEILKEFIGVLKKLPYEIAYAKLNALHYPEGRQSRTRTGFELIHEKWNSLPKFPKPEPEKAKRVGELIDIDFWFSGHFSDKIKSNLDFMSTVTSGSPLWFSKNGKKRKPTFEEKMFFMGAEKGDFILPEHIKIPQHELDRAAGNGVCVNLGYHWGKTVIEEVLRYRHIGDGYFLPIDETPDSQSDNGGVSDTVDITPVISPSENISSNPEGNANKNTVAEDKGNNNTESESIDKPTKEENSVNVSVQIAKAVPTVIPHNVVSSAKSKRIVNSLQLKNMVFQTLKFTGEWLDFLGETSHDFHACVHGLPGNGKSTFCIIFAHYLAEQFGRVVYVSGEEGICKTFNDKVINNKAASKFLDVAAIKTYEDILRIPVGHYQFIFIDSLDTMKVDAEKMLAIRARYKNTALITISQSTKKGDMRGSQELQHDADILIMVEKLVATTTKNRFAPTEKRYELFTEPLIEITSDQGNGASASTEIKSDTASSG